MRMVLILMLAVFCLTLVGCASHQNFNQLAKDTQTANNYGLYLEPIDPSKQLVAYREYLALNK